MVIQYISNKRFCERIDIHDYYHEKQRHREADRECREKARGIRLSDTPYLRRDENSYRRDRR